MKNITKHYCSFVGEKTHNVKCVPNYPKLLLQRSCKEDLLPLNSQQHRNVVGCPAQCFKRNSLKLQNCTQIFCSHFKHYIKNGIYKYKPVKWSSWNKCYQDSSGQEGDLTRRKTTINWTNFIWTDYVLTLIKVLASGALIWPSRLPTYWRNWPNLFKNILAVAVG